MSTTEIKIKDKIITNRTGIWYYASTLLKDEKLLNNGKNQYAMVCWLKENNKDIIKGDYILQKSNIKIPSSRKDFLKILCKQLKIVENNTDYYELFDPKKENIIIIGIAEYRGGLLGILNADENGFSKMMFVHQALREVRLNTDKKWTILLCKKGYEAVQIEKIENAFHDEKVMKGCVDDIIYIDKLEEIVNYINFGNVEANTDIKKRDVIKISIINIYSHGKVDGIYFWYDDWPYRGEVLNKEKVNELESSAFCSDATIYSYACRTGIGNTSEDFSDGKDQMLDKSLAQELADVTRATVFAYLRRTSYKDTIVKPEERPFIENNKETGKKGYVEQNLQKLTNEEKMELIIDEDLNRLMDENYKKLELETISDTKLQGLTKRYLEKKYEFLYSIWQSKEYRIKDVIFYPKGALHPVTAAETPKGLPETMYVFTSKK